MCTDNYIDYKFRIKRHENMKPKQYNIKKDQRVISLGSAYD